MSSSASEPHGECSGMKMAQITRFIILTFAFGSYLLLTDVPAEVVDRIVGMMLIFTLAIWTALELMVKYRPGWIEALDERGFLEVHR